MRKLIGLLIVLVLLLSQAAFPVMAEDDYPEPTQEFYVNDFANQLNQYTESKIYNLGRQLEDKTGAQVVLVTIDSLNGNDLETYSIELAMKWGIGKKQNDNGVLMLFSKAERQLRIEVGYGLEGALPDSKVARIREDYIKPYTAEPKNDFDSGLYYGYLAIVNEVANEYGVKIDTFTGGTSKTPESPQPYTSGRDGRSGFTFVLIVLFLIADGIFFRFRITSMLIRIAFISSFFRGGRGGG
ncbi:MAG: TPM domain-containing protein, partial [Ruminiclostridium sp.]|nr:TPM domain-containing protein [Ruminiclostridium sp.]